MFKDSKPLSEEKIKVLLGTDVEIQEKNLRDCIFDMVLEMLKENEIINYESEMILLPKEKLKYENNKKIYLLKLDELFIMFEYFYFKKNINNTNVARNFRNRMSKYRIRTIDNIPHIRKVNMSQEEIEECRNNTLITTNENSNLHFIISEEMHDKIFYKTMKNEAGALYYIYYRTGTPIFTNKKEEYYEICCINENKLNKNTIKFYNKQNEYELIKRSEINIEKLSRKCKLYNNLITGNHETNKNELLGIGTNLVKLKLINYDEQKKMHEQIGKIHFIDLINIYGDDCTYNKELCNKWEYIIKHIENNNYSPRRCESFCPYYKECNTAGSIIETLSIGNKNRIIENEKETEFKNIDMVRDELKEKLEISFDECLNNNGKTKFLKLIKCQTGIGKTTAVTSFLKRYEYGNKHIIYATPTIETKKEFVEKLNKRNIRHIMTPDFDEIKDDNLKRIIENNQKLGMYNTLKEFLNESKQNKNISNDDREVIENHINFRERSKNYNIIVSTHKMLEYIKYIPADLIIIDEDFIEKSGYNMSKIYLDQLNFIIKKTSITGELIKKKIKQIENINYKTLGNVKAIKINKDKSKTIENECKDINISFDIISFLESNLIYYYNPVENENEEINSNTIIEFMKTNSLPENDIIMLSATTNAEMYEKKYGNTMNIECIGLPKCKYYGNIYQFSKLSYSKNCIESHEGILDRIKSNYKDIPIITYKKYCSGKNEYNFGAINGLNALEGQDILVVGTYRRNILYYLMLAYDIYGKTYDTSDIELDYIDVERNDFTFKFYTFKDETLRNIELWAVYSELEQSIGRARLVNPENSNTNVYVYSGFPAEQAQLCKEASGIIDVDYEIIDNEEAV